jgi:hypothetical protein
MTRDQIIALVGKAAIIKEKTDAAGGELLELKTVPKPHRSFEQYILFISREDGLLKMKAISTDIESASDGAQVRDLFNQLKDALTSVYSKPTNDFDFVQSGSLWDKPEDFMMALLKQERTLNVFWASTPSQPFKDKIEDVDLEAIGLSTSKAYLILGYEFVGWDEYVEKLKSKESSVF